MDLRRAEHFVRRWLKASECDRFLVQHVTAGDRAGALLDTITIAELLEELAFRRIEGSDDDDEAVENVDEAVSSGLVKRRDVDPTQLVERIQDAAADHCNASGRRQRYSICACNARTMVIATHHFTLAAATSGTPYQQQPYEDDTEPPNERGVIRQTLRHTEALMRMQLTTMQATLGSLSEINVGLMNRVQTLEAAHLRSIEVQEEALSQKHDRELAAERQHLEQARKNALVQQVQVVGGAAIARMNGSPLIAQLFENLGKEKVMQIFALLDEKDRELLTAMIKQAMLDDEFKKRFGKSLGSFFGGGKD